MAHYLVYWKAQTVADNESSALLMHSASNQYEKVKVGDVSWIVSSEGPNDLVLVGRQSVDQMVGQLEAERITNNPNLWAADLHAITKLPEAKANLDISPWAFDLEFDGGVDSLPDGFSGQHLQTLRRLTYSGINVLERLWARRNENEPIGDREDRSGPSDRSDRHRADADFCVTPVLPKSAGLLMRRSMPGATRRRAAR